MTPAVFAQMKDAVADLVHDSKGLKPEMVQLANGRGPFGVIVASSEPQFYED